MRIEVQDYLRLVEGMGSLCFFDIEATGFRGDYNSILVISVKPFAKPAYSFHIKQPGNDNKVVRQAKEFLESFDCWCGYYSKGFDIPMLNTRLLKWGVDPVEKKHHIDMFFTLKANLATSRKSLAHMCAWLDTPEQKMSVSPEVWNEILYNTDSTMQTMVERCESDCSTLEHLYNRTKHLIHDIKR